MAATAHHSALVTDGDRPRGAPGALFRRRRDIGSGGFSAVGRHRPGDGTSRCRLACRSTLGCRLARVSTEVGRLCISGDRLGSDC